MTLFFLNEKLIGTARGEDALIMHPHAQRTGGGTIRRLVLARQFGTAHVYSRMFQDDAKPWRRLTDADLAGYRAFTDLDNFRNIHLARPVVGLALLRHPLYRAISLYGLVRSKPDHRHHELAMNVSLEEFYRRASEDNPRYFRELQCRRISRRANARLAIETLNECFIGVGFTNHLSGFVPALAAALGWRSLQVGSVAPDEERYARVVTPKLREMVLDQNPNDLMLFETMMAGAPYTIPARSWGDDILRFGGKLRRSARKVARRLRA
jgi:hypothetical protein